MNTPTVVDLDCYQQLAARTACYDEAGSGSRIALAYLGLKLAGEAGEVAQKLGKALFRHDPGAEERLTKDLIKELGGVLWYTSQIARELRVLMSEVATQNIGQLDDRAARGVIKGSGDDR